jgi:tetratricopeptide (TPR) repeat protein
LFGEPQQALTHCQQALALNRKVGDRRLEADTMGSLGYAHHLLGQHRQAIDHFQQSIAIEQELGNRHTLATTLDHLGDAHLAAGDRDAAHNAWQQALSILDQLGVVQAGIGPGMSDADKIKRETPPPQDARQPQPSEQNRTPHQSKDLQQSPLIRADA